ncbi:erythroid differentiation-related factor 1-like [Artemia franciscana]|uniref:Erythroid differentiation-related factor 1 n=1 Tax=Artemia franciscana TaxID=6661 RepID=A0AA88HKA1_ARTSF|nr:hypothetical protein QYM36_016473 [Artemia franciscana]
MGEDNINQEKSLSHLSTRVRHGTGDRCPVVFSELQCNTNLNLPPANWLSGINKRYGIKFNTGSPDEFSSFNIASAFMECIGEVDVVADAESIKKLLKIPFSKASISMLVHRIGKTLLIDEFDVYKHLIQTEESDWKWLSKFFQKLVEKYQAKHKVVCRTSKSRDVLLEKKLEKKFLCHTIELAESCVPDCIQSRGAIPLPDVGSDKKVQKSFVGGQEEECESEASLTGYSRNIIWNFEDIRMLVGSDMPIFGDGKHPCVSLRLRDMNKPISILTGMDYWLDNLMCNVPEVVMCCHLGGLVKQYELHKTEDLPNLKGSEFSPSIVRDVAKNILSFLKSKATKAGHTYWLFRGKDDDIVKLYDLTSICTEVVEDPSLNPVTVPLGILLYKVAVNIYRSSPYDGHQGAIRTLLTSSLPLLNEKTHLDYIITALYILNDLYVPSDLNPASPNLCRDEDENSSEDVIEEDIDEEDDDDDDEFSVSIESLCFPASVPYKEKRFKGITEPLELRCIQGLSYGVQALRQLLTKSDFNIPEDSEPSREHEPEMARPFHPIPMPYEPLFKNNEKKQRKETMELQLRGKLRPPVKTEEELSHEDKLKCAFLYKFILSYLTLAEAKFNQRELGCSLHNINMAARVWELLESYRNWEKEANECLLKLKTYALAVAGDIIYVVMRNWKSDSSKERDAYNNAWENVDNEILDLLDKIMKNRSSVDKEATEEIFFPSTLGNALEKSKYCYSRALYFGKQLQNFSVVKRRKHHKPTEEAEENSKKTDYDIPGLLRRLGNIHNDLGVYYMDLVTSVSEDNGMEIQEYLVKSKECLKKGFDYFEEIRDSCNMALLKSNSARLYRLRSHLEKRNIEKEMSPKEQSYISSAIEAYKKALEFLGKRDYNPGIWDAVQWDLSTTSFNAACVLQENPPLSVKSAGDIEREVASLFLSCLKYSQVEDSCSRLPLYQYRIATIHFRLAAQYHSSLKRVDVSSSAATKMKQLAEKHYRQAADSFLDMDFLAKYLAVQLERCDLILCGADEDHRLKQARAAISCYFSCHSVLHKMSQMYFVALGSGESTEDQDKDEADVVLRSFLKNLLKTLLQTIQLHLQQSKKTKKVSEVDVTRLKEVYQVLLKVDQKPPFLEFLQSFDLAFQKAFELMSSTNII